MGAAGDAVRDYQGPASLGASPAEANDLNCMCKSGNCLFVDAENESKRGVSRGWFSQCRNPPVGKLMAKKGMQEERWPWSL